MRRIYNRLIIMITIIMAGLIMSPVKAYAVECHVSTWTELKNHIESYRTYQTSSITDPNEYYTIILDDDIVAGTSDTYISVNDRGGYCNIKIDMNGHDINRNLSSASAKTNGFVMLVKGQLYIVGNGKIIGGNNSATSSSDNAGGGICVTSGGDLALGDSVKITGNKAVDGSYNGGGGVFISGGTLALTGSSSIDNNSGSTGGGILVAGSSANVSISGNASVSNNTATQGGGIAIGHTNRNSYGGNVFMYTGSSISNNTASGIGGGICSYSNTNNTQKIDIRGGVIDSNKGSSGGGIYAVNKTDLDITGGTISNNTATGSSSDGGGIHYEPSTGCTAQIKNATITGNTAGKYGSGIYGYSDSFTLYTSSKIYGNTTDDIYWNRSSKKTATFTIDGSPTTWNTTEYPVINTYLAYGLETEAPVATGTGLTNGTA